MICEDVNVGTKEHGFEFFQGGDDEQYFFFGSSVVVLAFGQFPTEIDDRTAILHDATN